jgi:hypothetical protein
MAKRCVRSPMPHSTLARFLFLFHQSNRGSSRRPLSLKIHVPTARAPRGRDQIMKQFGANRTFWGGEKRASISRGTKSPHCNATDRSRMTRNVQNWRQTLVYYQHRANADIWQPFAQLPGWTCYCERWCRCWLWSIVFHCLTCMQVRTKINWSNWFSGCG